MHIHCKLTYRSVITISYSIWPAWKPDLVIPGAPGCSFAIFWARAQFLPPTLSSTASTSLLHVGFPNLSTYREFEDGGGQRTTTYM